MMSVSVQVLKGCREDTSSNPPSSDDAPIYDELYVISQYWGTSVFHRMAEVVPRVAMCIDFLRRHPEILIHAQETAGGRLGELLVAFGIDQSRLVKGVVRAKVVYQPRSTPCGTPNIQESQIAAYHYHHYISNRLRPERRDRLLLIRRTIERKFTEHVSMTVNLGSSLATGVIVFAYLSNWRSAYNDLLSKLC